MIVVRVLLFLALATIAVAAILYLRFIGQVVKYTIYLLAGVMMFYVLDRLLRG